MNTFSHLSLVAVLILSPTLGRGVELAKARMWCLSLRFQQGSAGLGATLDLTTINNGYNGELAPTFTGRTYYSDFALDAGFPVTGVINVDLPPSVDANGDGFDDFFDVTQAVQATSTGVYATDLGGGTVAASWRRAAGSKDGTCILSLHDDMFGPLGDFQHNFAVLEYTGSIAYQPGTTNVTGTVSLTRTGIPDDQLGGQAQFTKLATDRFNKLTLQPGSWTNSASQTLDFLTDNYLRDTSWPTNFFGYFDFQDGDLSTGEVDYTAWFLSIDDLNDANHNGIPDFSDDPQANNPPRRPQLSLISSSTNLTLTIAGDIGHTHQVQEIASLSSTNWQMVVSITLTNDPQPITLALPAGATHFWRILAQ